MSVVTINDEHLKNIANAIRQKSGETDKYKPSEMANAIKDIPVGGSEPILQNITIKPSIIDQSFVADTGYDAIGVVNVSKVTSDIDSDIKAENIKKGISILGVDGTLEEGIAPTGEIEISENGTYDVTNYASAVVEVDNGGSTGGKYTPRYHTFSALGNVTDFQEEIESIDTSRLTSFARMFSDCTSLINVDISSWNTQNVTTLAYMFNGCSSLQTLNMSGIDLKNVQPMHGMFRANTKLKTVNFRNTNPQNATSMNYLFYNCSSLSEIDLRDWNVSPTNISYLFEGCSGLKKIDIRNFSFDNVTSYSSMFSTVPTNCKIIVKDDNAKSWLKSKFSSFSNIKTVAEYQAEGGV